MVGLSEGWEELGPGPGEKGVGEEPRMFQAEQRGLGKVWR